MDMNTPETDSEAITPSGFESDEVSAEFARKLERERDEARELLRLSSIEANALATSIQKSEYSDVNDFQLCESVAGVISQINNMYAGVREQRDEAREKIERQANRIRYLEGATNHACGTPLSVALRERDEARKKMADALQEVDLRTLDFERMKQEREEAREEIKRLKVILDLIKKDVS